MQASTRAALLNLLVPGLGYAALRRRTVLAALLLAYSLTAVALSVAHVLTVNQHWHHLLPAEKPIVGTQVALFAAQHAFVAIGVAADAWQDGRRAEAS